jgi:hypothetical protein
MAVEYPLTLAGDIPIDQAVPACRSPPLTIPIAQDLTTRRCSNRPERTRLHAQDCSSNPGTYIHPRRDLRPSRTGSGVRPDRDRRPTVRVQPPPGHPTRCHGRDHVGVRPARHPLLLRRRLHRGALWRPRPPVRLLKITRVQQAYRAAGISLPRTASEQFHAGTAVADLTQLRPGDLVFVPDAEGSMSAPGHVGIYLGSGLIIDAPQTGQVVHIGQMQPYWTSNLAGIRRVV